MRSLAFSSPEHVTFSTLIRYTSCYRRTQKRLGYVPTDSDEFLELLRGADLRAHLPYEVLALYQLVASNLNRGRNLSVWNLTFRASVVALDGLRFSLSSLKASTITIIQRLLTKQYETDLGLD